MVYTARSAEISFKKSDGIYMNSPFNFLRKKSLSPEFRRG